MPEKRILPILSILISLMLNACGGNAQATATIEPGAISQSTLDLCAPENITGEIEKVHRIMREFDDETLLAQYTPRSQLNPSISTLQRIRREAEDQPVPTCLVTLKQHQLAHMNTVINTFLGVLSGVDEDTLNQNIALARQQHDEYTLELANLLGITIPAPPSQAASQGAPVLVFNPGPTTVNLYSQPDVNSQSLGILDIGASTVAVGRNTDGSWIEIAVPDQPGLTVWVYTESIQLSGAIVTLPITAP
jgi:hypothetical protein